MHGIPSQDLAKACGIRPTNVIPTPPVIRAPIIAIIFLTFIV
jgi:hypothetical protein